MKKILKKIFFPFDTKKYKFLENKRWHRVMKVLFFILTIFVLYFIRTLSNNGDREWLSNCINNVYQTTENNTQNNQTKINECITAYNINSGLNLPISLIIIITSYYMIQIIYFKIIIHIIYSNNKK